MLAFDAAAMRAVDAAAVARDGEIVLMTRAGEAIATLIDRYARERGPLVAIAGAGGNGGDAYAALAAYGAGRERIVYADPAAGGSAARRDARLRALAAGVEERPLPPTAESLAGAALVIDGILGANARLPLDPAIAALCATIAAAGMPVLALDVPTGVEPSTGALDAHAVHATATIALGATKRGTLLEGGREAAGELWCAPIGMHESDAPADAAPLRVTSAADFTALLPQRAGESDKRSSGAPLIIAGSGQFPGAAVLCALGAARSGAGYVTIAAPESAAAAIRAHLIEQVVVTYDERDPEAAVQTILDLTGRCDAIGIGPGLGLSDAFGTIVNGVLGGCALPAVADASALFHLAKRLPAYRDRALVLTPHAGEFARLSGKGTIAPGQRLSRLRAFVDEHGITTLLKGASTLIGDRTQTFVNPTGTNALATAGTGDVLTGIIATLLGRGLSPLDAARTGAYWHGLAGRAALRARVRGVIARDVAETLGSSSSVSNATQGGFTALIA